jgi:hypothetical protein
VPLNLERLGARLAELGFDVGEVHLLAEGGWYGRTAYRVQTHTPESLQAVCREVGDVAKEYGVERPGFGFMGTGHEPRSF